MKTNGHEMARIMILTLSVIFSIFLYVKGVRSFMPYGQLIFYCTTLPALNFTKIFLQARRGDFNAELLGFLKKRVTIPDNNTISTVQGNK